MATNWAAEDLKNIAPDRYTLKQILQEIETIFALREFLPANIAVPALETAIVRTR